MSRTLYQLNTASRGHIPFFCHSDRVSAKSWRVTRYRSSSMQNFQAPRWFTMEIGNIAMHRMQATHRIRWDPLGRYLVEQADPIAPNYSILAKTPSPARSLISRKRVDARKHRIRIGRRFSQILGYRITPVPYSWADGYEAGRGLIHGAVFWNFKTAEAFCSRWKWERCVVGNSRDSQLGDNERLSGWDKGNQGNWDWLSLRLQLHLGDLLGNVICN